MGNLPKFKCLDCGKPSFGLRCKPHANKASAAMRKEVVERNWKAFFDSGGVGKRGRRGTPQTEEWKRAASERMRKRPMPKQFDTRRKLRGPDNPSWKGGRTIDTHGYVRIRIDGKYVKEHRDVMEKMLGRKLDSSEQVHHRDGNRQNNDPSNLELRSGPHGRGATKHCPTCTCESHTDALSSIREIWDTCTSQSAEHADNREQHP